MLMDEKHKDTKLAQILTTPSRLKRIPQATNSSSRVAAPSAAISSGVDTSSPVSGLTAAISNLVLPKPIVALPSILFKSSNKRPHLYN